MRFRVEEIDLEAVRILGKCRQKMGVLEEEEFEFDASRLSQRAPAWCTGSRL